MVREYSITVRLKYDDENGRFPMDTAGIAATVRRSLEDSRNPCERYCFDDIVCAPGDIEEEENAPT